MYCIKFKKQLFQQYWTWSPLELKWLKRFKFVLDSSFEAPHAILEGQWEVRAAMQLLQWHMGIHGRPAAPIGTAQRQSADFFFATLAHRDQRDQLQWMLGLGTLNSWDVHCIFHMCLFCFIVLLESQMFPDFFLVAGFDRWSWFTYIFPRIEWLEESVTRWPFRLEGCWVV